MLSSSGVLRIARRANLPRRETDASGSVTSRPTSRIGSTMLSYRMNFDFTFVILLLGPVVLLAIWAIFRLVTRKPKGPVGGSLREDAQERTELTGNEQTKQRIDEQK